MGKINSDTRRKALQKMSELLRAGAVMLSDTCPECDLPLFKLKSGEIVCPIHGRIYVARSEEEAERYTMIGVLDSLENIIIKELVELKNKLEKGPRDFDEREQLIRNIVGWLEVIERIERIKRELALTSKSVSSTQSLRR